MHQLENLPSSQLAAQIRHFRNGPSHSATVYGLSISRPTDAQMRSPPIERTPILACLVPLLVAASAAAAPPDTPPIPAAAEPSSAVYALTFQLSGDTPPTSAVTLACHARIVPALPGGDPRNAQPAATRPPSGNQCPLDLPSSWSGCAAPAVSLDYEIDSVSAGGDLQPLAQSVVPVALFQAGEVARIQIPIHS
jgi:hypothetical protein